jgi:hypothetical protein
MKWFDKWFYDKMRYAERQAEISYPNLKNYHDYLDSVSEETHGRQPSIKLSNSCEISEEDAHCLYDGLKIDIKRINGGYIVTFRHRGDNKSQYVDEMKRNSYIVNSDDDFNEQLGKLITMELLK